MNRISTVIEPDAQGTIRLPLPEAWLDQAIRVEAKFEPANRQRLPLTPDERLAVFRQLQAEAGIDHESAKVWKNSVIEARR